MTNSVSVALIRDEILKEGSPIVVDVPAALEASKVARAIHVAGVEGAAEPIAPGRYRWSPASVAPPGRHTLVMEAILDEELRLLHRRIELPFYVVATRATFPEWARVESFTRIRRTSEGFERLDPKSLPDGEFLDVLKVVDRNTGRPLTIGFDREGRELDAERLLQQHNQRLLARRDKLDAGLQAHLASLQPGEEVLIDAWFSIREPRPSKLDRPRVAGLDLAPLREREHVMVGLIRERGRQIVEELGRALGPKPLKLQNSEERAPVLTLRVPVEQVRNLSRHDDIRAVFLHEQRAILDLGAAIAIAGSDAVHQSGQTGEGVRVAVWEGPPFQSPTLDALEAYQPPPPPNHTDLHATAVHDIIRNKGTREPSGHAPRCHLVSANSVLRDALTWAVGTGRCSIINQSFHRPGEASASTPSSDDHYCDWLAAQPPYPLIVQAAGNLIPIDGDNIDPLEAEYVNHKGYNTITVACHDDQRRVAESSTFRNPQTPHGDRELPEISANGTLFVESQEWEGTSFAAPAVSAAAALIQGAAPVLACYPEGCRAILLAAAGPRDSAASWWQDVMDNVDAKDGAGALNALESFEVARCMSARDAAATSRGWDVGLLELDEVDSNGEALFRYRVAIPSGDQESVTVRVALVWRARAGDKPDYWSSLSVDLDLCVYDANGVRAGFSGSWDNNYEIAQFDGIPGATYEIRIRMVLPGEATWYGIAWTAGSA